ncbi:hypothetical protein UA08_08185 [Talaromyces atroroseus]|uniref:RelA/SpoT domain-containing protein n=1 Tax=Talaromyces atroroseus TaxID=1441469 RepID=A0A225APT3_TALAT|nr:hypothetical protein UA08_08185 [Talaromyces atroroseus]OKL56435.1 hypothetical protein UA08_08185 [Talaromyces atroroseus]
MDTMGSEESSKVISDFLRGWNESIHYYHNFAKAVADKCRRALESRGIEAEVTYRAKKEKSLANKLNQRSKPNPYIYKDREAILHDIQDLAGVRIVVKTLTDQIAVHSILYREVNIEKYAPKQDTPTTATSLFSRKHNWYSANHYVARRRKEDLELQSFGEYTRVEIQVPLAFQHAFAKLEHDIVYKGRSGSVTLKQLQLLDNLSGLVGVTTDLADLAINESDQKEELDCGSFENFHQLGVCLSRLVKQYHHQEADIGPLEGLQRLLKFRGLDNPISLGDIYDHLESSPLDMKEATMRSYGNYPPRVSVRVMDYIVFSIGSTPHESDIDRFSGREILAVIVSTFIWLNELFTPHIAWLSKLLSRSYRYEDGVRHHDLTWLSKTRLEELRDSEMIGVEDEERLRRIARWFSHHTERPVKLAFSISSLDSSFWRDLDNEWHLYVQAISVMRILKMDAVLRT